MNFTELAINCKTQVTGCGLSPTSWYILLAVLFVIATIAMLMTQAKLHRRSPLYCTGTGTGQHGPHYHDTGAEVDRCEGTR